jgi:hypothetical protein
MSDKILSWKPQQQTRSNKRKNTGKQDFWIITFSQKKKEAKLSFSEYAMILYIKKLRTPPKDLELIN